MTRPRRVGLRADARLAIVALVALVLAVGAPSAVLAQDSPMRLALLPIGQAGSFFDLVLQPGDSRTVEVEIANDGDAGIAARTYAADVYTIINGGFGGRLRDQARSGMTAWIDYPTEVLQLAAGERTRRRLTVAVPVDAGPGEYIASLILENDQPFLAPGAVGLEQVVRQAVAVVVTVPGQRSPGLAIGEATHSVLAGASIVRIAVQNTGNVRLKPIVRFTLEDASGAEISRATIQMDTFYSHTSTFVEFPLAALLVPGTYAVHLTLADAPQAVEAERSGIALVVASPARSVVDEGIVPGLIGVVQDAGLGRQAAIRILLGVGILLALLGAVAWLRRRLRTRAGGGPPISGPG